MWIIDIIGQRPSNILNSMKGKGKEKDDIIVTFEYKVKGYQKLAQAVDFVILSRCQNSSCSFRSSSRQYSKLQKWHFSSGLRAGCLRNGCLLWPPI